MLACEKNVQCPVGIYLKKSERPVVAVRDIRFSCKVEYVLSPAFLQDLAEVRACNVAFDYLNIIFDPVLCVIRSWEA